MPSHPTLRRSPVIARNSETFEMSEDACLNPYGLLVYQSPLTVKAEISLGMTGRKATTDIRLKIPKVVSTVAERTLAQQLADVLTVLIAKAVRDALTKEELNRRSSWAIGLTPKSYVLKQLKNDWADTLMKDELTKAAIKAINRRLR